MRSRLLLITIIFFLFFAIGTSAATVTNTNTGLNFDSVQAAIDDYRTTEGHILIVESGTYYENVVVTKPLTIRGNDSGGGWPVIDAQTLGSAVNVSAGHCTLQDLVVTGSSDLPGAGILIVSNQNTIKNVSTINNQGAGVFISHADDNVLTGIFSDNNTRCGFYLSFANNNTITNSTASGNHVDGITVESGESNRIFNSIISANDLVGISLISANNTALINNNIIDKSIYGISLSESNNNLLTNNNLYNISYCGVFVYNSVNNLLIENSIIIPFIPGRIYSPRGIIFNNTHSSLIANSSVRTNSDDGISLLYSMGNILSNNVISHNHDGIYLFNSSTNLLVNNNASNNSNDGIYLFNSSNNNSIIDNTVSQNNEGIVVAAFSNDNSISSNTATQNLNSGISIPIVSFSNKIDANLIYNNVNGISHWNSKFTSIQNNLIFNNSAYGIYLTASGSNILQNNIVHDNLWAGISLQNSPYNVIGLNNIYHNNDSGIDLYTSGGNSVFYNFIHNNTVDGIYAQESNYNVFSWNYVYNNSNSGIYLNYLCYNNTLQNNSFIDNLYGLSLHSSNYNTIYNNYFKNSFNVVDDGTNIWNTTKTPQTNLIGGSWLGGNYWHNYAGSDTDGDGLGNTDIPYNVSCGIAVGGDWLPLTNASGTLPLFADFTSDVTSGTAPLTVHFTDLSLNSPTGWAWYFGDENFTAPWTQVNASPGWSARSYHSSVVMPDGSIVLMGGYAGGGWTPSSILMNDVWRSTDNGATWTQINASAGWTARFAHSSVVMPDGSIVLMGGGIHDIYTNDVWRSTDKGSTWTQMTASAGWSPRYGHSSVVMPDGSIVLMGGFNGSSLYNDVWRSTNNGATWTQVTASAGWAVRYVHTSVVMPDGSIVLMGGVGIGEYNDVWRSTDNGATWTQLTANAGWDGRHNHRSVVMPDGSIVLMGGYYYRNDVWRSTDNGATWTQLTANAWPSGREAFSSVVMPDGSIVLMGGGDNTKSPWLVTNDVWRFMPVGSSARNPSHTYTTPGTYKVALQAYNAGGYNSTRKTGYISVKAPSEQNLPDLTGYIISFQNATKSANGTVIFNGLCRIDNIGNATSSGSFRNIISIFGQNGTWDISDNIPAGGNKTLRITVNIIPGYPTTDVVHSFNEGIEIYIITAGGNIPVGSNSIALEIDSTSSIAEANETNNHYSQVVYVENASLLKANFSPNVTVVRATTGAIKFTDTGSTGSPTWWNWSFGDGSVDNQTTNASRTHSYATSGAKTVALTVANSAGSNTTTSTINVYDLPVAAFTATPATVATGTPVTFDSSASTGSSLAYAWNFGAGATPATSTLANPTCTYSTTGMKTISLTVSDPVGPSAPVTHDVTVILGPAASFTTNVSAVRTNGWVKFTDASTGSPDRWNWSFGDSQWFNSTSTSIPEHQYTTNGTYTASLTVFNAVGANTATRQINVYEQPLGDLTGTPTTVMMGQTVTFNGTTTGFVTGWSWNFGAGASPATSTNRNQTVTYSTGGLKTITLMRSNPLESNTTTKVDYIIVTVAAVPIPRFTGTPMSGAIPLSVAFNSATSDALADIPLTYLWTFGDGNTTANNVANPVHLYTSIGPYDVSLRITNASGYNTTTKVNYITVNTSASGLQSLWNMTLNVTSGSYNQNVTMGSAASATRGYDTGLDVPMPPDPPGARKIVYFSSSDPIFDRLSSDYKPAVNSTNTVEYWTLYLKSDEPVLVTWNTAMIGDGNISFTWNDGSTTVNMRSTLNTTLSAGEYFVNVSASTSSMMDIPLKAGWNLVSVPFSNAQYVVPPGSVQIVYSYNPVTRGYEAVQLSSLEPGTAYWVASTRDCIINVTGTSVSPISKSLKAGWNLIGGSNNPVAFGSIGINPAGSWSLSYVYGYNTQTKTYQTAATLQPGAGYWGAVNRDCTITVP